MRAGRVAVFASQQWRVPVTSSRQEATIRGWLFWVQARDDAYLEATVVTEAEDPSPQVEMLYRGHEFATGVAALNEALEQTKRNAQRLQSAKAQPEHADLEQVRMAVDQAREFLATTRRREEALAKMPYLSLGEGMNAIFGPGMPGGFCPFCGSDRAPRLEKPEHGSPDWWDDPSAWAYCAGCGENLGQPVPTYSRQRSAPE